MTPGPWTATRHYVTAARGRDGHPGFTVADTQTFSSYGISDDERFANARLIAAAPDLLAACKEASDAIAYCIEWSKSDLPGFPPKLPDALRESFEQARAAIAKAEGR